MKLKGGVKFEKVEAYVEKPRRKSRYYYVKADDLWILIEVSSAGGGACVEYADFCNPVDLGKFRELFLEYKAKKQAQVAFNAMGDK